MQYLDAITKVTDDFCSFPRKTIQYHGNPSLCPNQEHWRSWTWMFLWRSTRSFRTNTPKDVLFILVEWNAKVGSQETLGVTGTFGLGVWNEVGQRIIEFCQENALVIANLLLQQHKRRLYTWTSPDCQHWNQIDNILCSQRWRSLYSPQKQDQELTVAQIRNTLLPNSDLSWRK